ncbi:MAG: 4'-phosphopantetheinyl transferase family protein [Terriglobia bacterium]
MIDVYWLEQTEADVPAENDWLSASEAVRLDGLRFAKRRADWRLGRWTAKQALAAYLNMSGDPETLTGMEVRPAPSGAPEVFVANQPAAMTISLSHRAGTAICAVMPAGGALGCDLETIEPRSDGFIADYFTAEEQALVARAPATDRPRLLALLWSGKESALKALRVGLRLDTRCVSVSPVGGPESPGEGGEARLENPALTSTPSYGPDGWRPLHVRYTGGEIFHGWWVYNDSLLYTVVATPPPAPPIRLKIPTPDAPRGKRHSPGST